MKKIAIRKLNRTLLQKESTNEIYITGKEPLMNLFGYKDVIEVPIGRKSDDAKKEFYLKESYYGDGAPKKIDLAVTLENNEVRLTGFSDYLADNDITEVDSIVLECISNEDEELHLLSFIRNPSIRVLQKYDPSNNVESYDIKLINNKKVFDAKKDYTDDNQNLYWLWDDHYDENKWAEIVVEGKEIACFGKNKLLCVIRIVDSKKDFELLMKSKSRGKNLITQRKKLYRIEKFVDQRWVPLIDDKYKLLEFIDHGKYITARNREDQKFEFLKGELKNEILDIDN